MWWMRRISDRDYQEGRGSHGPRSRSLLCLATHCLLPSMSSDMSFAASPSLPSPSFPPSRCIITTQNQIFFECAQGYECQKEGGGEQGQGGKVQDVKSTRMVGIGLWVAVGVCGDSVCAPFLREFPRCQNSRPDISF